MKSFTVKNFAPWWLITLKGLFLFSAGLYVLFHPDTRAAGFKILPAVGGIWVLSGIGFTALALISRDSNKNWKRNLIEGVIDLAIGSVVIADTVDAGMFAPYAIGAWAVIAGAIAISQAFLVKSYNHSFWPVPLAWGAASIVLGFLMLLSKPIVTELGIIYILSIVMIIAGIYQMAVSLKFKNLISGHDGASAE